MNASPRHGCDRELSRQQGMTVIEIVVSLLVLGVAFAAASIVLTRLQQAIAEQSRRLAMDQTGWSAIARITEELREADPASIGKEASSGCVRMLRADVEELFDWTPRRTKVRIMR